MLVKDDSEEMKYGKKQIQKEKLMVFSNESRIRDYKILKNH